MVLIPSFLFLERCCTFWSTYRLSCYKILVLKFFLKTISITARKHNVKTYWTLSCIFPYMVWALPYMVVKNLNTRDIRNRIQKLFMSWSLIRKPFKTKIEKVFIANYGIMGTYSFLNTSKEKEGINYCFNQIMKKSE